MASSDQKYERRGNRASDQAEATTVNPGAADVMMRCLIEMQVISTLLANNQGSAEDLRQLRQSIADSIT